MTEQEQPDGGSKIARTDDPTPAVEDVRRGEDDWTVSDVDQTASDSDQTVSDADQTASDRDQDQSEADQRISDRDQVAADREHADSPGGEQTAVYESARAERLKGTIARVVTSQLRAQTAGDRDEQATARDENARLRDLTAAACDRAAELTERAAANAELEREPSHSPGEAARARATEMRAQAAADRERAAADRIAAAQDREQASKELQRAQVDALTGALGRELGLVALEREINRARHSNEPLMLAFLDVDGLKQVNDNHGHAAGDALLQSVVKAIESHLRSYDPIVRVGGDEFVCALADCTAEQAHHRFQAVRRTLTQTHPDASISVGFAQLRPQDTLTELTARGDTALYEAKSATAG